MHPTKANPTAGNGGDQRVSVGDFNGTPSIAEVTDVRCRRCGRVLHSEKAIDAGAGWRCLARLAAEGGGAR